MRHQINLKDCNHNSKELIKSNLEQKLLLFMKSGNSALKKHFLSSVLPFSTSPKQQQFTKTKQFYKPDKFIWNNPHRTSKKMYKFFHSYNDHYSQSIQPMIQKIQSDDRQGRQKQRIRKLTKMRSETRSRFLSRKKDREQKSLITTSRRKLSNPVFKSGVSQNSVKSNKQTSKIFIGNKTIQASYRNSLESYDNNASQVKQIIKSQLKENHKTIRSQFLHRKKANEKLMNKIMNKTQSILEP